MRKFLISIGNSILSTLVISFLGCGVRRPVEPIKISDPAPESVVIFIPGFKGAILATDDDSVSWVSAAAALTNTKSLVFDDGTLGFEKAEKLHSVAVLDSVAVVPYLFSLHFYDLWIDALKKGAGKSVVVPFAYDWRKDNVETVQHLSEFVRTLRQAGVTRVYIVAHSMGALVTAYFLRYGTQTPEIAEENWEGAKLIDGAVLLGCPYRGATTMLRDMQQGVTTGINTTLLEPDAIASFPSSFQLLPILNKTVLVDANFQPLDLNWSNPEFWKQNSLGILGSAIETTRKPREKYVSENLTHASKWLERVNALTSNPGVPVPVLNIVGSGFSTLDRLVFSGGRNVIGDVDGLEASSRERGARELFVNGDGTVSVTSATIPAAYQGALCTSDTVLGEHGSILLNSLVQNKVSEFLSQLEKKHQMIPE